MPCDQVQITSLAWGPSTNHDRMFDGLKDIGLNPTRNSATIFFSGGSYDIKSNTLSLQGGDVENRTSLIKQAYSGSVVKAQAKRFGWQIKETSRFNYVVQKRSI